MGALAGIIPKQHPETRSFCSCKEGFQNIFDANSLCEVMLATDGRGAFRLDNGDRDCERKQERQDRLSPGPSKKRSIGKVKLQRRRSHWRVHRDRKDVKLKPKLKVKRKLKLQ